MGIVMKNTRWFFVMNVFFLTNLIAVKCASYCYSHYNYYYRHAKYYCYYYNNNNYYYNYNSGEKTAGTIAGIVVGSVVGSILFVSIMIFVCVKVFKKTNHGRVIVRPAQAAIFYSDASSQSTPQFFF